MQTAIQDGRERPPNQALAIAWKVGSILAVCFALLLATASFGFHQIAFSGVMLVLAVLVLCAVAILHARFLRLARAEYRSTNSALEIREIEFQSIFENALDAIFILDNQAICRNANPSALQLLGLRREQLIGSSINTFYPDQQRFDADWRRLLTQRHDRGQAEVAHHDNERVFVEFTAVADFLPDRHLISMRDVTERHRAERVKEKSLALARSAWQEADMLRHATLALTQDLRMSSVLDTLLAVLHRQIPYETAQVLLLETSSKLFLAREAMQEADGNQLAACPETLDTTKHPFLQRALEEPDGILIPDTIKEEGWKALTPGVVVRSWLGIPLSSSNGVVGLLCAAHTLPHRFTAEHLRIARSLAIAASVAIQNARLYECAEIYASELNRGQSNLH